MGSLAPGVVQVQAQLLGTPRVLLDIPAGGIQVGDLQNQVAQAVGRPAATFKIVHQGQALSDAGSTHVKLSTGDVLLVVPQRKPPAPRLVKAALSAHAGTSSFAAAVGRGGDVGAAADSDDDEEELPAQLPPTAFHWERVVVERLKQAGWAPWAMDWVVLIRPFRLLMLLFFIAGCVVSSRLSLGPVFILTSIVLVIVSNLGRKKAGEVSAYSICNPDVQRLPGQLDAEDVDRQIRQGQMM